MHSQIDKIQYLTYSDKIVSYTDPKTSDFSIQDIERSLKGINRFNGAVPWNVWDHSKLTYKIFQILYKNLYNQNYINDEIDNLLRKIEAPGEYELVSALIQSHDFTEAYMADVPTGLKQLLPEYKAIEHNMHMAILEYLGINLSDIKDYHWEIVKLVDQLALLKECKFFKHPLLDILDKTNYTKKMKQVIGFYLSETISETNFIENLYLNIRIYNFHKKEGSFGNS